MRMNSAEDIRREIRTRIREKIGEMKLRALWRVGSLVSFAQYDEDEEGNSIFDAGQEGEEEEEEDLAAKWLLEKEEKLRKEQEKPRVPVAQAPGKLWATPEYESDRFGRVSFSLPPASGMWPEDPGSSPAGFPLGEEDVASRQALTQAFQKPETWNGLAEASRDPRLAPAFQSWLVPKVILLVGKKWWNDFKHQRQLKMSPFGLFDSDYYRSNRDRLDKSAHGRAWIALVQQEVARILAKYLSSKGPGKNENIHGYIYTSLHRKMAELAGANQGYKMKMVGVCGYCKFKRPLITPPELELDRETGLYKCPVCEQSIENNEEEVGIKQEELENAEQQKEWLEGQIQVVQNLVAAGEDEQELLERHVQNLRKVQENIPKLRQEVEAERADLSARKRFLAIPYVHVGCANEDCPVGRVPLTSVDWSSPYWSEPEGKMARAFLSDRYNIVEPGWERSRAQRAEDHWDELSKRSRYSAPPDEMLNVPFICPYDGTRFTPAEAKGRGPMAANSGYRVGGMIIPPPLSRRWVTDLQKHPGTQVGEEDVGPSYHIEDVRELTGAEVDLSASKAHERFTSQMEFRKRFDWMRDILEEKRDDYREKIRDEAGSLKASKGSKARMYVLREDLYEFLLDWSSNSPIHFVGWVCERAPRTRKVMEQHGFNEDGTPNMEFKSNTEYHAMSKEAAEQVNSMILQGWMKKVMERHPADWLDLLVGRGKWGKGVSSWLTTEHQDGVPPVAYFISPVEQRGSDLSFAPCMLRYTKAKKVVRKGEGGESVAEWVAYGKKTPLGIHQRHSKTYKGQPRIAAIMGVWDYRGQPVGEKTTGLPIPADQGDMVAGDLRSLSHAVAQPDFKGVYLRNDQLGMADGDHVLVKAVFMPWSGGWLPMKIMHEVYRGVKETADHEGMSK